jgi:hypothetical protein
MRNLKAVNDVDLKWNKRLRYSGYTASQNWLAYYQRMVEKGVGTVNLGGGIIYRRALTIVAYL